MNLWWGWITWLVAKLEASGIPSKAQIVTCTSRQNQTTMTKGGSDIILLWLGSRGWWHFNSDGVAPEVRAKNRLTTEAKTWGCDEQQERNRRICHVRWRLARAFSSGYGNFGQSGVARPLWFRLKHVNRFNRDWHKVSILISLLLPSLLIQRQYPITTLLKFGRY